MPILMVLGLFGLYVALQTLAVLKVFPGTDAVTLAVAFVISDFVGYGGVVLNGIFPPIPLGITDLWAFVVMFYLGMALANGFALNWTLDKQRLGLAGGLMLSAALNLGLCVVLGGPLFYATLATSTMLFQ